MSEAQAVSAPPETIDVEGVMRLIPHRYPMLLVDRMVEIVPGVSAVGIKNVTVNEPFFPGHFPDRPIMPGVLIVEAMGQTAAALIVASSPGMHTGKLVYFTGVDQARFRSPVVPGDCLRLQVSKLGEKLSICKFEGKATVDGRVAATATFTAKIIDR